jgi:hypothetical protein
MKTDEYEEKIETIGEMTVQGSIVRTEWDKRGNVTGVGIECNDEEYVIFLNKTGEKLLRHLNRKVEATGTVKKVFGELILTVGTYRLLKEDNGGE